MRYFRTIQKSQPGGVSQVAVKSFVEGSVFKAKHRIRVLIRLTDVATGFRTWREVYALQITTFQEMISNFIADALAVRLGVHASVRKKKKRPSQ